MKIEPTKFAPQLLNFDMGIDQEMLTTFNDDLDFLKKAITGHESWVYDHDIESKPNHLNGNVQKS